jgi:outer membrane receptor protein involved in Fe transport
LQPFEGARWSVTAELARHLKHNTQSEDEVDGDLFNIDALFWKTSVAATARQEVGKALTLWAGARYDLWLFDSLPGVEGGEQSKQISSVSPRFVLIARPSQTGTFKAMVGRGFRSPSVYELTYRSVTQLPAPDLDPETIISGELEYSQELPENFVAVGNVFLNKMQNRIERTGLETEEDPLQFKNIDGDLWSAGGEFELRRTFLRGWMASGQYSLQSTRAGEIGNLFSSRGEVLNSPTHLASLKVIAPLIDRYLLLGNRVLFEAGRLDRNGDEVDPAVLWDVALSGALKSIPVKYAVRVQNALDWQYDQPAGDEVQDTRIRQPGRAFVLDVAAEF